MIVRICPMCDSEMKKSHYCDVCHSWIWKPQMLDVHYNSSSRGMGEIDCAYGDEHDAFHHAVPDRDRFFQERFGQEYDERSDESSKKARTSSTRQAQRERAARQREKTVQQRQLLTERQKENGRNARGRTSVGTLITVIVIIYIIAGILFSMLGNL